MGNQFADQVLEGDGFQLSPLDAGDIDDVTSACRDEVTQRWLPLPLPYACDAARAFIQEAAPAMHASGAGLVRRIEVAGRLCGVIDLKKTDWHVRETEIGYWVAPWARGRGLAGKAPRVLADWVLSDQGMARSAGVVHAGRVDLAVFSKLPSDLHVAKPP